MESADRDRWMAELRQHEIEMERLALEARSLEDSASRCGHDAPEARQLRRRAEFALAQGMRHGFRVALLAARLNGAEG
jgi:hypothetical protein